jgi:hypothetical protein
MQDKAKCSYSCMPSVVLTLMRYFDSQAAVISAKLLYQLSELAMHKFLFGGGVDHYAHTQLNIHYCIMPYRDELC